MEFNERLIEMRSKKGLSQAELADIIGVSPSAVSMFEQGRRFPRKETFEAIADYFNVGTDYLLGKEERTVRYIDPYYADLIENPLLKRILLAGSKLPEANLQAFVQAMEMAANACDYTGLKK